MTQLPELCIECEKLRCHQQLNRADVGSVFEQWTANACRNERLRGSTPPDKLSQPYAARWACQRAFPGTTHAEVLPCATTA